MPSAPTPRLQQVAAAVVVIALTIGVGTLIGREIAHRRAASQLKERVERDRAADAAEARREREETRREHEREAPEKTFDDANDALLRAAKAGRRGAVARAEATLTQLARQQAVADRAGEPTSKSPFERELDRFPIKQRPLFAQQIGTNGDDHVFFVSVYRPLFCLTSERERREAVRETYEPIARRLHKRKIDDFELLVVPLGQTAPRRSAALARATGGTVALTSRGRSC